MTFMIVISRELIHITDTEIDLLTLPWKSNLRLTIKINFASDDSLPLAFFFFLFFNFFSHFTQPRAKATERKYPREKNYKFK